MEIINELETMSINESIVEDTALPWLGELSYAIYSNFPGCRAITWQDLSPNIVS